MAFWVDDRATAFALGHRARRDAGAGTDGLKDEHGEVVIAAIRTYGDTIHSLVERKNYRGLFMPGFRPTESLFAPEPVGLEYVDHCVGNVELGKMNEWVQVLRGRAGLQEPASRSTTRTSPPNTRR